MVRVEKKAHEERKFIKCPECSSILSFTSDDQFHDIGDLNSKILCPVCQKAFPTGDHGHPFWDTSLERVKTPNEREVKLKVVRHVSEYDGEEHFDYMIECDGNEIGRLDLDTIIHVFSDAESIGKDINWN